MYNERLAIALRVDKDRALESLRRMRDAQFVRGFYDFAERLGLRPGVYRSLVRTADVVRVVDMVKATLKGSVLSVQSLVWRTRRLRAAVGVLQRWLRARLVDVRRVKAGLKEKWRVVEAAARERIRADIAMRDHQRGPTRRRSAAEQHIHDLLFALLSDAWMDEDIVDAAIHRCLMARRCRYVDCFRVWKATSMRDFRARASQMNVTRTAMRLLECAMSLRFPLIQFTVDGVSVDELAYHAVAEQMRFPEPRPTVPPARPFLRFLRKSLWEKGDDSDGDSSGSATKAMLAATA